MSDRRLHDARVRPISRRFTTLEGWRQTRDGLHLFAGSAISSLIPNPAYDPEWQIHNDGPARSILSRSSLAVSEDYGVSSGDTLTDLVSDEEAPVSRQHNESWASHERAVRGRSEELPKDDDPFSDSNAIFSAKEKNEALSSMKDSEKPYHVFSKKQKWVTISIIGVAGLFSGLSSNIYFPALDTIAKVRSSCDHEFRSWKGELLTTVFWFTGSRH